jgi:choline-sulfatase
VTVPNVIVVVADQLRADALGCYGNELLDPRTPHLDTLAEEGVLFERAFTSSPVCVPARAAMHTGLHPEHTGVYGNEATRPTFPPLSAPSFADIAAAAGRRVAAFGKEHLPNRMLPWDEFDPTGSRPGDVLTSATAGDDLRIVRWPIGGVIGGRLPAGRTFLPTAVTDNALAWLAERREPFLLSVGYLQPHTPVVAPEPFASLYDDVDLPEEPAVRPDPSEFERRIGQLSRGAELSVPERHAAIRSYYALACWVDNELGRLRSGLRDLGLGDRTHVVFVSDHGWHLGESGAFGKHTFAPESQRIPLLVTGPGLPGGERRNDLAAGIDVAPTVLGLLGIDAPEKLDGRDLFDTPPVDAVYSTIGFGHAASRAYPKLGLGGGGTPVGRWDEQRGWPRRSCVRTDRWRYDRNIRLDGAAPTADTLDEFLADSRDDPLEGTNLAASPGHQHVLGELRALLDSHTAGSVETPDHLVDGREPAA